MKRIGLAFAIWAFASFSALAQVGGLSFPGPGPRVASGGGGFSLTYGSNAGVTSTGTTINYGTLTWGSGCNAVIIAVNWYNSNAADTISSMTVGGSAASAIANTTTSSGTFQSSVSLWQLNSPSGSSGAVSVTYSAATTFNSSVAAYCLVSSHTTVSSSASQGVGSGVNATANVTIPAGGGAVVVGATNSGATITWTNATQDAVFTTGSVYEAYAHNTTSSGAVSIVNTPATAQSNVIAAATFGP